MSPQEKPCSSGCKGSPYPRLFLCLRCRDQVVICSRCDRGQVYCGRECASEVRRSKQRKARRRYQAERTRAAAACRSEPPISRPRPPRDGSGSGFGCAARPTARTGTRSRSGGQNSRQRRYRALKCLLPLRRARLQHGPPVPNSSTAQTLDQSLHRPTGTPTTNLIGEKLRIQASTNSAEPAPRRHSRREAGKRASTYPCRCG